MANFNMDIERERSKRRRIGGDAMLLRGEGLERRGFGGEDEQAGDIRESELWRC